MSEELGKTYPANGFIGFNLEPKDLFRRRDFELPYKVLGQLSVLLAGGAGHLSLQQLQETSPSSGKNLRPQLRQKLFDTLSDNSSISSTRSSPVFSALSKAINSDATFSCSLVMRSDDGGLGGFYKVHIDVLVSTSWCGAFNEPASVLLVQVCFGKFNLNFYTATMATTVEFSGWAKGGFFCDFHTDLSFNRRSISARANLLGVRFPVSYFR